MALPMLIGGGAECGPSNPLQGLSKRFDQDRGIQQVSLSTYFDFLVCLTTVSFVEQDHFGAGRAGSSKEVRFL